MTLSLKADKCCLCSKELKIINGAIVQEKNIIIAHKVCLERARKIRYHRQQMERLNLEWEFFING